MGSVRNTSHLFLLFLALHLHSAWSAAGDVSVTESPSQGLYVQETHIIPQIGFECIKVFLSSSVPRELQVAWLLAWPRF
jgi:hypothetical protein